jgi:phosphohistidine phosphatase
MKLLVIRHAIAEERDEFAFTGRPDSERPLTREGRERMRRAAQGLANVVEHIDVLATSPYTRAAQTADIVAAEYHLDVAPVEELTSERAPDDILPWLREQDSGSTVAIVGHEPHLGFLVGWLLTGRHESFVELKKGASCLLEFDDPPAPGNATLLWALSPAHLRALRKAG